MSALTAKRKKQPFSMTEGPLFSKIFFYTIPIMLSGMLQLMYNAADNIVIGQFSDNPNSLAAVGSTGALTNLIVNLLFGLSVGTGVCVAKAIGSRDDRAASDAIHTSVAISAIGGVLFGLIGFVFSSPLLRLLDTKPEVLSSASLYMKVFFCGMPANSIYNFGAAILRAKGDTKRPMIILSLSGIVNVLFNLAFVILFKMDVAGVALATIISQYISATAIIVLLMKEDGICKLHIKNLGIKWNVFKALVKIGLPAGLQGTLFSLSNSIIQSAVNSFSTAMVNGNTVASTIEGFVYIAMNSYYHAALTFESQNLGAKKHDRIIKTALYCTIQVVIVGATLGFGALAFGKELAYIIKNDSEIASCALIRMSVILPTYFLCGIMEVYTGSLRALGKSTTAMISCIFGACVFRILWIEIIFPLKQFNSPFGLYISYPISWVLTAATLFTAFVMVFRSLKKKSTLDREF